MTSIHTHINTRLVLRISLGSRFFRTPLRRAPRKVRRLIHVDAILRQRCRQVVHGHHYTLILGVVPSVALVSELHLRALDGALPRVLRDLGDELLRRQGYQAGDPDVGLFDAGHLQVVVRQPVRNRGCELVQGLHEGGYILLAHAVDAGDIGRHRGRRGLTLIAVAATTPRIGLFLHRPRCIRRDEHRCIRCGSILTLHDLWLRSLYGTTGLGGSAVTATTTVWRLFVHGCCICRGLRRSLFSCRFGWSRFDHGHGLDGDRLGHFGWGGLLVAVGRDRCRHTERRGGVRARHAMGSKVLGPRV
mmetsp:Transcript_21937/g.54252  ORF Transcript_21937/g.54252 Transcript_21937/m.54252 type:complete len:303 (-) Transcript_21937:95-1003(-)